MNQGDKPLTESAPAGNDFLAQVCQTWEAEALKASSYGVNVSCARFGIVLGTDGGALKTMLPAFKLGLASPLGSGNQWFSWIHKDDLARSLSFLLNHPEITGAINICSPDPVTNKNFTKTLAAVLHRPAILPAVPAIILKPILGELGDIILKGQRVLPKRLEEADFEFNFPELRLALINLLH